MIDGDPMWPDLTYQWSLAQETRPSLMGVSPTFLMNCAKAGLHPAQQFDLSSLRVVGCAGAPLPAEGYRYVYDELDPSVMLLNGSGGTDVCTGLVSGSMFVPVYEGEIAAPALGVDAQAFDENGRPVIGELGELVITKPMPSMPVRFWNDPGDERYRSAYFDLFPGVWRQGDWIRFTDYGSCVITGRSDATLNRAGVRFGTSEIYVVVEQFPQVTDSLVVHLEDDEGGPGELVLFVALADGAQLDDDLRGAIARALRSELSPRHVPDTIAGVPAIPRTLTGKKLETPVKRILQGRDAAEVANPDALADPSSIDAFVAYAASLPVA
jgi:acetoacetyl-CoA synthetase